MAALLSSTEAFTVASDHVKHHLSDGWFSFRAWRCDQQAAKAQALVEKAHQFCPYSKATRGNIEVNVSAAS